MDKVEQVLEQLKPSYINLSKKHNNEELKAIKKDCIRTVWKPSINTKDISGHLIWNLIEPPMKQVGLNKIYIGFEASFIFTYTGEIEEEEINEIFDKLYINDINSALYYTYITMNGQSVCSQPYINLNIKRLYDKEFYTPEMKINKHDKNVFVKINKINNKQIKIDYLCSTPLLHSFTYTNKEIAGIRSITIDTEFNLTKIFNFYSRMKTGENTEGIMKLTVEKPKWLLYYNLNINEEINEEYKTLINLNHYFVNTFNKEKDLSLNYYIRDLRSAPLNSYLMNINDQKEIKNEFIFKPNSINPLIITTHPRYTIEKLNITINGNNNAYNLYEKRNVLLGIYHCCKEAGFLGVFDDFNSDLYPMVYGFTSLQYRTFISSNQRYRFDISSSKINNQEIYSNYEFYIVFSYPALFISESNYSKILFNYEYDIKELKETNNEEENEKYLNSIDLNK